MIVTRLARMKIAFIAIMKAPPKELILVIPFIPCELSRVTRRTNRIARIPISSVELKIQKCQRWVVSCPNSSAERVIHNREALETSQRIQLDSQMKVPMKASFSPIDPANQE